MTKGLWVYFPSPMFSKTCIFLYFNIFSHLHLLIFFPPQSLFHKPYPQSKTFLNIRAVPSSAVLRSNTVLITTPSCSMQFFNSLDVLSSAPTTTGMTLMLLMFHIFFYFSL